MEENEVVLNLSNKKILIVDDNKLNLKVAERLIQKYNPQIETVESGFECLKKIEDGNIYDLIFMDDMMPEMSGTETQKNYMKMDMIDQLLYLLLMLLLVLVKTI